MNGKKILILGVGSAQVDAIRWCREQDLEVFGVSYRQEGAGLSLVDHFACVDIADNERVLAHAENIGADVVYSVGSDLAMPAVGYASERLGLPFYVKAATAELTGNKEQMRALMQQSGLQSPMFAAGSRLAHFSEWDAFPAVIKPVDSQGQRGIFTVHDRRELAECFGRSLLYSRSGRVIVEEFVDGVEISVNVFVRDGIPVVKLISDRLSAPDLPGDIATGHAAPSAIGADATHQVEILVERTIQRLGIQSGPVYFQIKCGPAGVSLIEVTPRLDGCHLWRLWKATSGIDLLAMSFRGLLAPEERFDFGDPTTNQTGYCLDYFLQAPGTPFQHGAHSVSQGAACVVWYYEDGEPVRPVNGYLEKVGYQIRPVDVENAT